LRCRGCVFPHPSGRYHTETAWSPRRFPRLRREELAASSRNFWAPAGGSGGKPKKAKNPSGRAQGIEFAGGKTAATCYSNHTTEKGLGHRGLGRGGTKGAAREGTVRRDTNLELLGSPEKPRRALGKVRTKGGRQRKWEDITQAP